MDHGCTYDVLTLGAGAAGLMATTFAARHAGTGRRVAALDGAQRIGAKILVSGGGRCNVTHDVVNPDDYAGANRNQIAKVLKTFSVEQTVAFFAELGVTLKHEDTGKLFPTTDRAKTVLDALLSAVDLPGVEILSNHRATSILRDQGLFVVTTNQGDLLAKKIILATGGKSLPKTGSDGLGYELAKSLGHTVTKTTAALVPLVIKKKHWLTGLSGLAADVELAVASGTGKVLHRQRGAMLMTHFGISGPAAMDISRHWLATRATDPQAGLIVNFLPARTFEQVETGMLQQMQAHGRATIGSVLNRHLPQRLSLALVQHGASVPADTPMSQLSKTQRRAVVRSLTALPLPIVRDRGYLFAEATAGGIPLSELNLKTMASRTCPGLYLCGEMLDVDGRIGGYNFQWAWCSGRLAGMAAAEL